LNSSHALFIAVTLHHTVLYKLAIDMAPHRTKYYVEVNTVVSILIT